MLTEPGTSLSFGDQATIAWRPRQDTVVALDLTIERIDRTTFKESFEGWVVTPEMKGQVPYFVRAKATNVGRRGRRRVARAALRVLRRGEDVRAPRLPRGAVRALPRGQPPGDAATGQDRPISASSTCCRRTRSSPRRRSTPVGELPPVTWTGRITADRAAGEGGRQGQADGDKKEGREGLMSTAASSSGRCASPRRWCWRRWRGSPTRPTDGCAPSTAPASTSAR